MAYVDQSQHNTLQGKAIKGVYGWTNLNDAILFSRDNYSTDAVVFEFETDEQIIDDPEFVNCDWIDGQAKFVVTSQAIKATKVWSNLD